MAYSVIFAGAAQRQFDKLPEPARRLEIGAVLWHKCAQTTARYSHLTKQASHALVRGTADKLLGGAK